MIAIVERLQAGEAVAEERFAGWKNALHQLRDAFAGNAPPAVEELHRLTSPLPADQREAAWQDLASIFLRESWKSVQGAKVEVLLRSIADPCHDLLANLLEEEFLARHQWPAGDAPDPAEYTQRFPNVAGLAERLDSHRCGGGRYVKLSLCGIGAAGQVWEAHDRRERRTVALKQLAGETAALQDLRRKLHDEYSVAASLKHPGIIAMNDWHGEESIPFFTMELIRGESLSSRIGNLHCPPPSHTARDIAEARGALLEVFRSLCEAMEFAHSRGILHLDLKPANILIRDGAGPVILDWGGAREAAARESCGRTAGVIGTREYMAPEQEDGNPEARSDVFGLGAILYEILTGRPPRHPSGSIPEDPRHAEGIIPPRSLVPSIPRELDALCLRALAGNPDKRFSTPSQLGDAVGHLLAREEMPAWRRMLHRISCQAADPSR